MTDQPPVAEFELEDEPGNNLNDLQGYRLALVSVGRIIGSDAISSLNNNSTIEE
jgi:hypothetical protein